MAEQLLHNHQCMRPLRDWNKNTKGGTREVQDATQMPNLPDDNLRDTPDEEEWVQEYERHDRHNIYTGTSDPSRMGLPGSRQERCYIGPFKFLNVEHQLVLTYTIEAKAQVWISDGDTKVLGRVKAFEEHCDEVMEQIKVTWIASPMVRNTKRRANQTHDKRPTSKTLRRGDSSLLLTWTKRPGPNGRTG